MLSRNVCLLYLRKNIPGFRHESREEAEEEMPVKNPTCLCVYVSVTHVGTVDGPKLGSTGVAVVEGKHNWLHLPPQSLREDWRLEQNMMTCVAA